MNITRAQKKDLDPLATLFDQYRVFYGVPSQYAESRKFIEERLNQRDSTLFVAKEGEDLAGFTQLYPCFSSVSVKPIWILNDLFVAENFRRRGVAKLLMDAAKEFATQRGALRIELATQIHNTSAQALYQSLGYRQEQEFYHYYLDLRP